MKEREISIIDLLVEILLHWRMFIVWMLAGAVLFGAFSFNQSSNAIKSQQTQTEELLQQPEDLLSEEEVRNVNYVIAYEEMYLAKEKYQSEATLMKLDPNCVNKAEATIAIISKEQQKSYNIAKVYEDFVVSSELIAKVAEEANIETVGINEMILLERLSDDNLSIESNIEENINTFRIGVIHNDEAQCKNMLESIITFLKEKQPDIINTLGKHEILVISQSSGVVFDEQIAKKQQTVLADISSMKKTVIDAKNNLSDVEKQYYDLLKNNDEVEDAVLTESSPSMPGISIKYVILGAVMAAFFYAFILFMVYIFNSKIRITDNFQELYNIPQLGMIPVEKSRKKLFSFIDNWLLSLRNRNKRQFTCEEALELSYVAVKISVGKEKLHEICLMGCGLKEHSLEVCEKIKARLEEDNFQINILNNVLYDAQEMEKLESAEGVVLIESVGSTLYNEITEELELVTRQEIKVLGGILVE